MYGYPMMSPYGYGGYGTPQPMYGGYQPQMQPWQQSMLQETSQVANRQGRMDNMQGQLHRLQEQFKGAGSTQQAGLQDRMTALQGRMGTLQSKMGDPNATGANRAGFGWRQERRQAQNQAANGYNPQAAAPQQQQSQASYNPSAMPSGAGYMSGADQLARQRAAGIDPNAATLSMYSPSLFNTQYGQLTPISGGNANVFKRQGGDENELFSWGPGGWQGMSLAQYHANPNQQYADPRLMAQQAGAQMQQFGRRL